MSAAEPACITGVGETDVGKVAGSTALGLMESAALRALEDAGLDRGDIDGLYAGRSMVSPLHRVAGIIAERLGMTPKHFATLEAGGATSVQMIRHAALAVRGGAARHVLCVVGDNLLSGLTRDLAVQTMAENAHPELEVPFGTFPPAAYALIARAHMHDFGTTPEQMAEVAVATRRWATKNPAAQMRGPRVRRGPGGGPPRAPEPFGIHDCALVSDGGGAFIVSEASAARDLRRPPVFVLGGGEAVTHEYVTAAPSLTSFGAVHSGRAAFEEAGRTPSDIDVAEIYDCFTITPIVVVEDLGFCAKGEGGPFVSGGRTAPGGALPMNTHGGLLSHAHPGKPGGIFHVTEAVTQLRGDAGARQAPGARTALVHGVGGMMSAHATAILSTEPP